MPRIVRRPAGVASPAFGALHPVLGRVYAARGVRSATELDTSLERLLPVGTLEGIPAAVELLLAHRTSGRVLVIGDFDADGATSSALVVRALRSFGFAADFLVPNRFRFGYGLTPEIVALALERTPSLIVTVDNGISSNAGVSAARARGIDVLITDHHLAGACLPEANVIVNPNLEGSRFGSRALAGVGVAFYLMAALRRALDGAGLTEAAGLSVASLLDLVALGTVADVVPLDANNRVLVAQGLKRIRAGRCVPGIRALLALAGRNMAELTAADLAFAVAPRLNAAGRIDDMTVGIQCLLEDDEARAHSLAGRLEELNQERRTIEAKMQQEAREAVRCLDTAGGAIERSGVCLFHESWHQGVVGLVASRVKDRVRRPVVAFASAQDGTLRGSARSVAGIHIRDVLDAIATRHPELLGRFGGHAMAAGLTLERARLEEFARAFDAEVARFAAGAPPADTLETDGELAPTEIALETAQALRAGGPWGQAFPEPSFDGLFSIRNARLIGERHVKMWVEVPRSGRSFDAVAFNHLEEGAALPAGLAQLVYRLEVNEYQGERRLQLLIDHLLPSDVPPPAAR
jgi:single-stranded-DNA-specific exonuclease